MRKGLIKPLLVNVGRACSASPNVIQEIEYVKEETKLMYILECLLKTKPKAIIFCENINDVDDIQEYLLLKGINAVGLHGDKS